MDVLFESLNVPNTGIMIIDMQNYYLEPFQNPFVLEEMLGFQKEVLDVGASLDLPLYIVKMIWTSDDLIPDLRDLTDKFSWQKEFYKEKLSAFSNRTLMPNIASKGIEHLVLMGVSASRCVLKTAEDAKKFGLNITTSPYLIQDSDGMMPFWYQQNTNWLQ